MELNITRQPIAVCELVLATTAEQPIECDVLLPDYCPDIVRVLSCQALGAITEAAVRGAQLQIEGTATVTLYYVGDQGGVKRTEYKLPFSKTIELGSEPVKPVFNISVDQGYLNCRAVSRRRLDIRGTVLVGLKLYDMKEEDAVTSADGMGVQLRLAQGQATGITGPVVRSFTVNEDLTTPYGKPAVKGIVRADCRPVVQECRVVAGRAVLKGELLVHVLYKSDPDEEKMETADYNLPLSQLLEVPGTEDDALCEVDLTAPGVNVTANGEYEPDADGMKMEAQLTATVTIYRALPASGACDCYSTRFESTSDQRNIQVPRLLTIASERQVHKDTVELPEGVDEIIDVWATPTKSAGKVENGNLFACCQLNVSMLTMVDEVGIDYLEHPCEVCIRIPLDQQVTQADMTPRFEVLSASASPAGREAQVTCELMVSGAVMAVESRQVITGIQVNEEAPRKSDPSVGLMIYYASPGEDVWDISKRYATEPGLVRTDNALESDTISGHIALIIPTV